MTSRVRLIVAVLALLIPTLATAAPSKATVKAGLNVDQLPADSTAAIAVTMDIPQGLHAQSNKPLEDNLIPLTLKLKDGPAKLANIVYPEGHIETYPALGKVSVYTGKITVYAIVNVAKDAAVGPAQISGALRYQLCDDTTCFKPVNESFTIDTTIAAAGTATTPANAELFTGLDPALIKSSATATPPPTQVDQPKSEMPAEAAEGPTTLIGAIGIALLAGLIFNVMPCVLPVLPLKALGFYEASHHNRSKTFMFGLSFSIGMTAVFAVLALVLLLSKSLFGRQVNWGQLFSYSWFIWTIAILLAAIAFSMLKGAAIQLPTGIYGLNFRHDTMVGNFLWGGLTAILSTPCTAFFFPGILIYVFTQPLIIGFSVITLVGVGMALPYLVLSGFPELARKFPRTGPFAEIFKQMMGFLMLVVAGLFFGMALFGEPNQYWTAYAILVIACVYLIIRTRQLLPSPRATVIAVVIAVMLSGGGFAGAKMLTRPLRGFEYYSNDTFAKARESGDIVLVKFTAAWCLNCKAIEQTVFQNDATIDTLQAKHVRLLKADLTHDDAEGWALLNKLGGNGIPFTAVYAPKSDKPITLSTIYTTSDLMQAVDKAQPR